MKLQGVWWNRAHKFFDNPSAIIYFIRRISYDYLTADRHVATYKKLHLLTPEETLNHIIDTDSSIVRMGDGEFGLMRGASVYFNDWRQKYSKSLRAALIKTISSHDPKILICLPGNYIATTKEELIREGKGDEFKYWINSKILLHNYIDLNQVYGSSFAFYPTLNSKIDYIKLKNYFNTKNVIIITSNTERFKDINLGKTTHLIPSPSSDSWEHADEIRKTLNELVNTHTLKPHETLVMVSMGPGAKAFVYELAQRGFTAWDAGQFFDLAYKKIKELSL